MKFAEELRRIRENKLENYALELAEEVKSILVAAALEGQNSLLLELEGREDKHMLIDGEFREKFEMLLEGCKVSIETKEYTNLLFKNKYKKHYLLMSW